MATNKKSSKTSKSFIRKVHELSQKDIARSTIIASLLFNVLFFAAIFVITSTDSFDSRLLNIVNERYCQNKKSLSDRVEKLGKERAIEDWHIACISKDFKPYYQEAIDKFRAANKEE